MIRGTLTFLFEQASLRTMSSFAAAGARIGLAPIAITTKGGAFRDQCDLYDEIDQLSLTSDCVVVRTGTELDRSRLSNCAAPVVNAGDASNEHPTQTILDIAVMRSLGLFGKTVAIVGNLRDHRTAHSLAKGLGRLPVKLRLVAPDGMAMPDRYVPGHAEVAVANTIAEVDALIEDADFIYLPPVRYWNAPDLDFLGAYDFDLARAEQVSCCHPPTSSIRFRGSPNSTGASTVASMMPIACKPQWDRRSGSASCASCSRCRLWLWPLDG